MFDLTIHHSDGRSAEAVSDLRARCDSDPALSLRAHLRGAHLAINWPHRTPQRTGEVRAQLISARMQQQRRRPFVEKDVPRAKLLSTASTMFVLLVTVPAVAFSVFVLCRWFGVERDRAKRYGILSGLASLFVELGLTLIQMLKEDRSRKLAERQHEHR